MKITADLTTGKLVFDGVTFNISCGVRTLKNGARKRNEIIRSVPGGHPYDPEPFPKGSWEITGVDWQKDANGKDRFDYDTFGPVKILTNAFRTVNIWELDNGNYHRETEKQVRDGGYWLHWSKSNTTLGCIRITTPDDAVTFARIIERMIKGGAKLPLEVV